MKNNNNELAKESTKEKYNKSAIIGLVLSIIAIFGVGSGNIPKLVKKYYSIPVLGKKLIKQSKTKKP